MRSVAVALVLLLAACGGGAGDGDGEDESSGPTTTTTSTAGADGTTTTTAGASAPSTTAAPATPPETATAGAAAGAVAPEPLAPGTYRYRQSGTAEVGAESYDAPPEGTMVADAAGADGTQVLHRYVDPEGEAADATMRFGADGMFVLETVLRMGGTEIRCTFDPPMASPAWPPAVGASASGHGECGAFTTDVTSEITEARTVDLDGRTYDAVVVTSTITTSGQVESTTNQIDWFVPELRLSAHTEQDVKGRFGAVTFTSRATSDLLSAVPT